MFSQLFHNSPFGKVMLDDKGKVALVNKGFEKIFGFTQEELQHKQLNQFIVPDNLTTEGNDLDSLISVQRVVRIDTYRKRKSGEIIPVIVYGVPIQLENKTIGIFGAYVDMSEQKRTEEELKVRNAELDNFVYKVSHDLRAPLSSVLGLVNLARLEGNTDNLGDYIKMIGQKVKQLDNFISDVLSHSKNLKLDLKIQPIDFHQLIEQTFINLNYLKGADQIKKFVQIESTVFYSDPWRVGEIFRNLISNAIKYRDDTKEFPSISINIYTTAHTASIIFSDNGIGIEEKSLPSIFDMFYRATSQADGSGLGLYIVKNAVDKLGGTIKVTSTEGAGTSFELKLPNHILATSNQIVSE
jgi:PAS domain S-box-containing protein